MKLKLCKSYAEVSLGRLLAIVEAEKTLEISIDQENVAKTLQINVGDNAVFTKLKIF
jgi:S-adenosylmethionine hydrolase